MSVIPEHFRLNFRAIANKEAVVERGNARFTVLTERLIRLEYHPSAQFEDRATQSFWYREQPVPKFRVDTQDNKLEIETAYLRLTYTDTGEGFTEDNLFIHVKATDSIWHPNAKDSDNLLGTIRTLDDVNGYTPLSKGLISRAGWSVVDDSESLVFNEECWLEPRDKQAIDYYFFGYGHDYKACLQDYCAISGQMPLIPRWILGNWWSRYWAYTQEQLTQLICAFEAHDIPLSICIIDMDWHITDTGNDSSGWTGYTWNRELFPDPQGFIDFLHAKNLRTALNLHPADGIHSHEEQYQVMSERLGMNPDSGEPIKFNITDPEFANAYFEELHHPNEAIGVDFWWVDWQQGQKSPMEGLDPLWLINHLHFYDSGRDGIKRPFTFSRWGNQGHQRYPIGFSGDSYITWETLRFQPYMTSTASNVAYGWWSHDIGGHTSGTGDNELFARWLQFGVFSPIMRIHTTKGYFYERRPWMLKNAETLNVLRDAMQLRHQFIPYLYTMAHRAHTDSLLPLLPMYYEYPEDEAAYNSPQQYLFGTELIAAPFVEPMNDDTRLSRQVVWFPEGEWYHFFTGEHFTGDSWQAVYGTMNDIPLFAKAGAIVPLGAWDVHNTPENLEIHIFAGADNTFTLYEDDGETRAYENGQFVTTRMQQKFSPQSLEFTVNAAQGDLSLLPDNRQMSFVVHGVRSDAQIMASIDGQEVAVNEIYKEEKECFLLETVQISPNQTLKITIETDAKSLPAHRDRKRETVLRILQNFKLHTGVRNQIADNIDTIIDNPDEIAPYIIAMRESHIQALCETLYSAGVEVINDTMHPTTIILWNNHADETIRYRYNELYLKFGFIRGQDFHHGNLPNFMAITPEMQQWSHGARNEHVRRTQWAVTLDYHNLANVSKSYREETP